MKRASSKWALVLLTCLSSFTLFELYLRVHRYSELNSAAARSAPAEQGEPLTMLWAWESPEDLTSLDPQRAGVAFLSRELLLGRTVQVRPRRQPLRIAPSTWLIAVVRIETAPDFASTENTVAETATDIAVAAQQTNIRAIQVDFDAIASQRAFYASVLKELRRQLPPGMPLSITALVSWCGDRSWLHALPIDEAVPMFFRMGGASAIRPTAPRNSIRITEPLCSGSVGISTDESWPTIHSPERVYVFLPGSWTKKEIARVNAAGYQGLSGDSQR